MPPQLFYVQYQAQAQGKKLGPVSYIFRLFGRTVFWPGCATLAQIDTFQIFFFQPCFNKKYVEVANNDFTMHLITLKWLGRQKCRQKRKTMT